VTFLIQHLKLGLLTFDVVVHSYRHFLDLVIGSADSDLEASGKGDWSERAVRCYCYVVCFCHCCDSTELGHAATVRDVLLSLVERSVRIVLIVLTWLYDIDRGVFKETLEVPTRV
jgi:hypothetical protein